MATDPRRRRQPANANAAPANATPQPPLAAVGTPPPASTPSTVPIDPPAAPPVEPDTTTAPVKVETNGHANGVTNDGFKLKFCTVCASNNNRSMEGHLRLAAEGYPVVSFGTGTLVRLPGPRMDQPNIYNFDGDSYAKMFDELSTKDEKLYQANGILKMLDRNREVKQGPERWQDWTIGQPRLEMHRNDRGHVGVEAGVVDIVITCEERCWDAVVEDLLNRGSPLDRPVHLFNVDIKDSHEEALIGGNAIVDLANTLNSAALEERSAQGTQDWSGSGPARTGFDEKVPDILADWQERWPQFPCLWTLAWF